MIIKHKFVLFGCLLLTLVGINVLRAEEAILAKDGVAMQSVVRAAGATKSTQAAAEALASYLSRISGGEFRVEVGDGTSGIAVGVSSDFPALELQGLFDAKESLRREEYLLRASTQGVLLVGATEEAVEFAVWDFLYRLGHRQFFPGETWEVVPQSPTIKIAVDSFEKPDFHTRLIWYGGGFWRYNTQPHAEWSKRNRAVRGFGLNTRHAYNTVIRSNPEVFEANPEYFALVDGERKGPKLCISNPGLRKFVIESYALPYFKDHPELDTVSLEPSDGGGWCQCAPCAALGSITDQALLLANEAAEAVSKVYPDKYVGFLAYNEHSPPPNIRVHPRVLVKIQTLFLRGGYTFDRLAEGWAKQGATIGVGDYYSIFPKDKSRPAAQKGSDLFEIKTSIPRYHQQGARFFMSESSDLWGGIGLGHYIAARLIWDVSEAENFDALVGDFLEKSFGPAKQPMEGFFRLIYRFEQDDRRPIIREDMVARMYRFLAEAKKLTDGDEAINARLDDLLLFTRYEELYQAYEKAAGAPRQKAVEELVRHAYRMRETMMVHSKQVVLHHINQDRDVVQPPEARVRDESPFTAQEVSATLTAGVSSNNVAEVGFTPISFSSDLVSAAALKFPEVPRGHFNANAPRARQRFFTWLDTPGPVRLKISGGHVVHFRNIASNVQVRLFAEANPAIGEEVAFDESVAPDGVERDIALQSPFPGLHQVEVFPPSNRAMVENAPSTPLTLESSLDYSNDLSGRWTLYFYVPKGTRTVGGFASNSIGSIIDGTGKPVFNFASIESPGFFQVTVPQGQDGKLWKFENVSGKRALLTVPPYLARSGQELLLPQEVVTADSAQ